MPVQYGPRERPPLYTTPRDVFACSPQGTPLDDVAAPDFEDIPPDSPFEALEDIESPDFDLLPPTPKDPSRSPARRRPRPGDQRRGGKIQPRRLFQDGEESCDPCEPPAPPPEPCEVCDSEVSALAPYSPSGKLEDFFRTRAALEESDPGRSGDTTSIKGVLQVCQVFIKCPEMVKKNRKR